ncbi:MAG TPA: GIY-YIG nuclease family protein [Flexivirga sp.]|uniref:GIY-YIG nuclease family protein n=1 Tax=Flexivirga sp. TaxID=1962927 RepID=UPI002C650AB4|nr:GIY-YIG nuclease family protein [Flexivirga sp.]HWC21322.1 GIY-YIG nuclease family protein [Flexivirga sp.]
MPWTYILRCGDGTYYVGSTRDLERRMSEHYVGQGSVYTSKRLPVELVWCFETSDVGTAWALERRIHGWSRSKREALITGRFDLLPFLSRRRTSSADD